MMSGWICILAFALFVKGQVMPACHYVLFLLRIVDGKIEKNEVCGACGAYGGGERCAQGSSGETRGKEAIGETQT